MDCLRIPGLVVFALTMASAAVAETHGETDGCLVTLYNYPVEAPPYHAAAKVPAQWPLTLKENLPARKTSGAMDSRVRLVLEHHGENKKPPAEAGGF